MGENSTPKGASQESVEYFKKVITIIFHLLLGPKFWYVDVSLSPSVDFRADVGWLIIDN